MKNVIEKERKFLMKRFPSEELRKLPYIIIKQCYLDGLRYRHSSSYEDEETGVVKNVYEVIKKIKVSKGINKEVNVKVITADEYHAFYKLSEKNIYKSRHIIEWKGRTLELDYFYPGHVNLVVLEVENVEMSDVIEFPDYIKENILMEVTGLEQFDNYNLARKTIKYND